ncbi:MAG: hypothetical protein ACHQ2F_13595 [Desulfobaccales bacterium]
MFEHRRERLLPLPLFIRRILKYGAVSFGLAAVSLLIGICGYRQLEGMSWLDAFVNAAMILGGMGPVGELHTRAGKLFAGCYALYCGLIVVISMGILIAPVFHRFLHLFHLEAPEDRERAGPKKVQGPSD